MTQTHCFLGQLTIHFADRLRGRQDTPACNDFHNLHQSKTVPAYATTTSMISFLLLSTLLLSTCQAFVSPLAPIKHSTSLQGGLFGNDGILGGIFGEEASGPKTVIDLPCKDVKIGALRFLLQIHIVSQQNVPAPKSWLSKQADDPNNLNVYYADGTAMLEVKLNDYSIEFLRHGAKPSLQYVLQESVLLHSILDELEGVVFGVEDNIKAEDRLVVLNNDSALQQARDSLPARAAAS